MAGFNRATLVGNLGQDPEIRKLNNGDPVATLRLATNETWRDKSTGEKRESVEWHSVVVFGALTDVVEKYLRKGSKVLVEGKIKTRKWQDRSGADRYTTEIVLSGPGASMLMLDSAGSGRPPAPESGDEYGATTAKPTLKEELDDEIPF